MYIISVKGLKFLIYCLRSWLSGRLHACEAKQLCKKEIILVKRIIAICIPKNYFLDVFQLFLMAGIGLAQNSLNYFLTGRPGIKQYCLASQMVENWCQSTVKMKMSLSLI